MSKRLGIVFVSCTALVGACASTAGEGEIAGVVSSASPEATAAGIRILERGGNAMDAAVAVSLALGVSEPAGSGIGGQVIMLVWHPTEGAKVILGSTLSPKKLPPGLQRTDLKAHRASTVPSALKVLDLSLRRFGSGRISWAETCAPAIECAEQGFVRGFFRRQSFVRYGKGDTERLSADESGRVLRPQLAATLRRIAENGARDFYVGGIANEIAADMRDKGGFITLDDLRSFPEPEIVEPLQGTYRGHQVLTLPPPAGGWVVLRALNVLENASVDKLQRDKPSRALWMAEALHLAHGDRYDAPVGSESELAEKLDKASVRRALREKGLVDWQKPSKERESGETTHFCVVDGEGMVVAVSQSLNAYYGAKAFAGSLGFLYNDYMREFVIGQADHPFELKPNRQPYSSMSATIVLKDGKPMLTVGSPGSRRIISAVVQVLSYSLDGGLSIADAVAAPRMHVVPEEDQLMLERRPANSAAIAQLESRGFDVAIPLSGLARNRRSPYFGGVHAIAFTPETGWQGAADPRRDGVAAIARRSR